MLEINRKLVSREASKLLFSVVKRVFDSRHNSVLHCLLWGSHTFQTINKNVLTSQEFFLLITTSKITLMKFTYPGQHPKIPSLFSLDDSWCSIPRKVVSPFLSSFWSNKSGFLHKWKTPIFQYHILFVIFSRRMKDMYDVVPMTVNALVPLINVDGQCPPQTNVGVLFSVHRWCN